ncbi:hypothetical protein ACVIWV_006175 [Bradyrhizobium diazoefficiens]|uniref:DUF2958 domain-containing protein n=1 Tax=Bradyrhizobium diazoefficiens TaxID=1355477 RepID=A0A0E3VUL1_9BRAD|nr:DUF2958 domain-containing protein [Bradyrhizobium diazoefficiens]MBR0864334.1 DUF2958 domain-containing protein [Bradyrhizobium diazoefficiens]MBR0888910.1 DUF2958 domain-containing protein [Bradyrhizobium diazoefficiens]MBR0920615.1 DUF2958 domain-containing protein [Bradyrhizobium diazoefficiens]WLA66046.1 DUF2958 domain-containing protein [Bradyrhizobium diazoefficiens]BAR57600.1 hypothetical protein NK6_4432 [Bradyrhizobium diazoefficiens]
MKIFTKEILDQLAANGAATRAAQNAGQREPDHVPVVKVFNPYGDATWLLTESDPAEPDRLYGLCDLGMGEPELGYVARSEMESVRVNIGGHGLPLERDLYWSTEEPLSVHTERARQARRIMS